MKKKELTPEEKAKKYGCNGYCYGGIDDEGYSHPMCGGIDTCEETRFDEKIATLFVFLMIILMVVVFIAVTVLGIAWIAHVVVVPLVKYLFL